MSILFEGDASRNIYFPTHFLEKSIVARLSIQCKNIGMSTLLEKAFEKARELSEPEQDIAAVELLGVLSDFPTPEERIALAEGRAAYERGEFSRPERMGA